MRKLLLAIGFVFFVVGCQDVERPEKPDDLIPEDQMIDILTDAYLSNAARSINNRTLREQGVRLDSIIFEKYQIDSVQFVRSNAYYTSDLNTYADMFTQVRNRLLQMKKKADSLAPEKGNEKPLDQPEDSLRDHPILAQPIESVNDQDSLQ